MTVGNRLGFEPISISAWWLMVENELGFAYLGLGLPISAWACQSWRDGGSYWGVCTDLGELKREAVWPVGRSSEERNEEEKRNEEREKKKLK